MYGGRAKAEQVVSRVTSKRESEKRGCKMKETQVFLFSALLSSCPPSFYLSLCCFPFTRYKQKPECKEVHVRHPIKFRFLDIEQSRKERINIGKVKTENYQYRGRGLNFP